MILSRIVHSIDDLDCGPITHDESTTETVRNIIAEVRQASDRRASIAGFARRFDARDVVDFDPFVSPEELADASVEPSHHDAIRESIRRVTAFHERQLATLTAGMGLRGSTYEWTMPASARGSIGYEGQRLRPVSCAGVYVPGGKAVYPSSVIMNAVPALVAGVDRVFIATPAKADGTLNSAVLVAARELGISRILKAGGAYGIAALAFGIGNSLPPCDVIAGPGNRYVNEAKRQLWGQVGTDLFAGPSEVAVFVDGTSNPSFAAADLLTQVEHADDNVAYLIATDKQAFDAVLREAEIQLRDAPREATMRAALGNFGVGVLVASEEEAATAINRIAPEHLSLLGGDPVGMSDLITNAGAILLGPYSAQSAGDFTAGPSHTLPTSRAARFASPVNVLTFMKLTSLSQLQDTDLMELLPTIEAFGEMEGFPAHARGATIRFQR